MAAMFDENFSFDTPRSPSIGSSTAVTRDSSRSVSPCSAAGPYPPPRMSVTDLAVQFASQRIRREAPISYDSCEAYANNDDDDGGWSIPTSADEPYLRRAHTFPVRPHSPSQRMQRQVNTRLLCSATHRRDIEALVARMVKQNEQCSITPPESVGPAHDDEGYDSNDDDRMTEASASRRSSVAATRIRPDYYRRSSDYSKTGNACVNKNIRLRKHDRHRRVRSSEDKKA